MTSFAKLTAGVFSAVALLAVASTASADVYSHLDNIAIKVKVKGQALSSEVRAHYAHTPYYRHLLSDSYEVAALADKVHDIAHHHGDIYVLDAYLTRLDRLFHHVADLIESTERAARYGHGHVACDTRHVKHLLHDLEGLLHHMLSDVKQLKAAHIHHDVHRSYHSPYRSQVVIRRPVVRDVHHGRPGHHGRPSYKSQGRRGGSSSIQVGSFRLHIGR